MSYLDTSCNPPRQHIRTDGDDLYAIYCDAMEDNRRRIKESTPQSYYRLALLERARTMSRAEFDDFLVELRGDRSRYETFMEQLTSFG